MSNIHLSTHFRGYTQGKKTVNASGTTIDEILFDLNRQYPGIRFRIVNEQDEIRHHIKIFLNGSQAEKITDKVYPDDQVHIIGALSGG